MAVWEVMGEPVSAASWPIFPVFTGSCGVIAYPTLARAGTRMFGALFGWRFEVATRRIGLNRKDQPFEFDTTRCRPPCTKSRRQNLL